MFPNTMSRTTDTFTPSEIAFFFSFRSPWENMKCLSKCLKSRIFTYLSDVVQLLSRRGPIAPSWCLLIDQFSWTFGFLPIRSRKLFNRFFRFAKTYRHAFVRSRELLHCLNVPYIWHPGLASTVSTLTPDWYKGIAPRLPSSQPLFMDFPVVMIDYFLLFFSSCFMLFR